MHTVRSYVVRARSMHTAVCVCILLLVEYHELRGLFCHWIASPSIAGFYTFAFKSARIWAKDGARPSPSSLNPSGLKWRPSGDHNAPPNVEGSMGHERKIDRRFASPLPDVAWHQRWSDAFTSDANAPAWGSDRCQALGGIPMATVGTPSP